MSLIDDIIEATHSLPKMLDHPQYIDGVLYVTDEQYDALRKLAADEPLEPTVVKPPPLMNVNVVIIKPGQTVEARDGRLLICSIVDKALYTLHPSALEKTGKNLKRALIEG